MAANYDTLVVTPSVRKFPYSYFSGINEADHIIIEDGKDVDRSELQEHPNVFIASREMVLDHIPAHSHFLFPTGNPSCKNFGLYWAFKHGYKKVVLLDDDVDTTGTNFMENIPVGKCIDATPFRSYSGWWNTLLQIRGRQNDIYARGYPYEFRGEPITIHSEAVSVISHFNEGLWWNTPDINGMDKANMDPAYVGSVSVNGASDVGKPWWIDDKRGNPDPEYVVLQPGQKLPLSIMNVQLLTELVPAFWQPPDYEYGDFRVRRHDDVWSMGFLKTIMDRMGHYATCGLPMVHHMKAGDPVREILSEHSTNLVQPYLFRLYDMCKDNLDGYPGSMLDYASAAYMTADFASYVLGIDQVHFPGMVKSVLEKYFFAASSWARLFI